MASTGTVQRAESPCPEAHRDALIPILQGAGTTLRGIQDYVAEHSLDGDLVEVGCIGICVSEPMVDVQLPGRTRVLSPGLPGTRPATFSMPRSPALSPRPAFRTSTAW